MDKNEGRSEIFDFLVKELAFLDNDYDRLVYPNIKESVILDLRRFHGLSPDIKIVYYRDIISEKSHLTRLVISDFGISYRCSYKIFFVESSLASFNVNIKWERIDHVEYSEDDKCFYFYNREENAAFYRIDRRDFIKKEDTSVCMKFAQILSEAAKLSISHQELMAEVFRLEKEQQYEEALSILDYLFTMTEVVEATAPLLHYAKGRILFNSIPDSASVNDSRYNLAKNELETALNTLGSDWKEYEDIVCWYLGAIYSIQDNYFKCRDCLIRAMNSDENWLATESKEVFEEQESGLEAKWDEYIQNSRYTDRQFIMPVREIKGCYDELIRTFLINHIPSSIKFPIGHPIVNELYMGHPYNQNLYIPYNNADEILFVDKIQELCYLLQCLGAMEITIRSIRGKSLEEVTNDQSCIDISAGYKMVSGEANINLNTKQAKKDNRNNRLEQHLYYSPTEKPFIPNGLVWYPQELQWQRLAESRLKGNILEYNQFVSTSETHFVSQSLENNIQVHFETLIAKANANIQKSSFHEINQNANTEWAISVKFKPMTDFKRTK